MPFTVDNVRFVVDVVCCDESDECGLGNVAVGVENDELIADNEFIKYNIKLSVKVDIACVTWKLFWSLQRISMENQKKKIDEGNSDIVGLVN